MQLTKGTIARVSIVIPILEIPKNFKTLILSLESQTFQDFEVIFVGTNGFLVSQEIITKFSNILQIKYIESDKTYPGEKRNLGIKKTSPETKLIAFLDVGTIPKKTWLKEAIEMHEKGFDAVFGRTKYKADNPSQDLIRSAVYGEIGHITLPGTLITKRALFDVGDFVEEIRAGEDVDWKDRVFSKKNCISSPKINLYYINLPNTLRPVLKKFLIYYIHTSQIYSLKHTRDLYLSLFIIFLTLLVPQWNAFFGGILYIPHITKIYVTSFLIFSVLYLVARRFIWQSTKNNKILAHTLSLVSFSIISISIFFWNSKIATFVDLISINFYFATELFILTLLLFSFLYRGIYRPLMFNVAFNKVLPFRWLKIGLIGILIDIAKFIGMITGSLLGSSPFQVIVISLKKIFINK